MKRALILSAETPSACAVVRGLHASGFEVAALTESPLSPAGLSWKCARSTRVGVWRSDELPGLVETVGADVVVPVTEGDLLRLAPVRGAVEALAVVLAPAEDVLALATDKVAGIEAVAAAGVPVPQQWVLRPGEDPPQLPVDLFPAVAKPSRSRALLADGSVWSGTADYVADPGALDTLHGEHARAGLATVVQRPAAGTGQAVSLLLGGRGEPSLVFVHRRVRELRPEGGPSACAESVEPGPALVQAAITAARALGLVGVPAQFEFRVADAGPPVLLDVNPRPWGSLALPVACGVNFYGVAALHALGEALPTPPPAYRAGVRRHYLGFEIRRAMTVVFGERRPGYEGPWPDPWDAALRWIFPPDEGMVGTLDDPLPAVGDGLRSLGKLVARVFGADR